jgi:hypothetical protein
MAGFWGGSELYSLSQLLLLLTLEAPESLNALGVSNYPTIPTAEDTVMIDLLADLQEMNRYLNAKIQG